MTRADRPDETLATLLGRLADLEAARDAMPPHSGQGLREELQRQVDGLRRRIAGQRRAQDTT